MPEKLNLPEESFIITEVTIIEQYLFLTERTAKETARKPLKKFEKLLYYSQFLFSNNHYMYRELPQEELHIPEEFAVIIKLWYQYLCQNGYLTPISATSLIEQILISVIHKLIFNGQICPKISLFFSYIL